MGTVGPVAPLCDIEVTVKALVEFWLTTCSTNVSDHSHPSLSMLVCLEVDAMRTIFTAGALLALAACTPNPGTNATEGAIGGAAVGCGIGAAVTAPLLGVGCVPGAIIGAASGTGVGVASTTPPPPPPSTAYAYP